MPIPELPWEEPGTNAGHVWIATRQVRRDGTLYGPHPDHQPPDFPLHMTADFTNKSREPK